MVLVDAGGAVVGTERMRGGLDAEQASPTPRSRRAPGGPKEAARNTALEPANERARPVGRRGTVVQAARPAYMIATATVVTSRTPYLARGTRLRRDDATCLHRDEEITRNIW